MSPRHPGFAHIGANLPRADYERLVEAAARRGTTVSDILRSLVREFLRRHEGQP